MESYIPPASNAAERNSGNYVGKQTALEKNNSDIDKIMKDTKDEIQMNKGYAEARMRIKDHQIALQQAQLETPDLLKQQIEQQDKILKELSKLNKNLEGK